MYKYGNYTVAFLSLCKFYVFYIYLWYKKCQKGEVVDDITRTLK